MSEETEQEKIEELKKKIDVLQWDKKRNQLNPGKLAQLNEMEAQLEKIREKTGEAQPS